MLQVWQSETEVVIANGEDEAMKCCVDAYEESWPEEGDVVAFKALGVGTRLRIGFEQDDDLLQKVPSKFKHRRLTGRKDRTRKVKDLVIVDMTVEQWCEHVGPGWLGSTENR